MAPLPGFGTRLQGAGLAHVLVKVRIRLLPYSANECTVTVPITLSNLKKSVGRAVAKCLFQELDRGIVGSNLIGVTALCP